MREYIQVLCHSRTRSAPTAVQKKNRVDARFLWLLRSAAAGRLLGLVVVDQDLCDLGP